MNRPMRNVIGVAVLAIATQAAAQVTFFEHEDFQGRSFSTERQIGNFERSGFNDRASSVIVDRGRWQVCEHARFQGQCVVLRPGRYESLAAIGLNNSVSSVQPVSRNARNDDRDDRVGYSLAQEPQGYDYSRRKDERLFQADVTSVRAVVGQAEQRCWVEREQVVQDRRDGANVPAAIAGGIIGGILGHQIGGGRGRDIATVGGAVGGAALGANIGRGGGGQHVYSQDVQRCANVSQARPEYYDVTYHFRGQEHRLQMNQPPGPTITVNRAGEPRV